MERFKMTSAWHILGVNWSINDYYTVRGKRYKYSGYETTLKDATNKADAKRFGKDWDGYLYVVKQMVKMVKKKKVSIYVLYRRKIKEPTSVPFDWNDPENIKRYNLR